MCEGEDNTQLLKAYVADRQVNNYGKLFWAAAVKSGCDLYSVGIKTGGCSYEDNGRSSTDSSRKWL